MAGRRATLTDLAAAVLADLLHLAPATAVRWMRQAGGDWSGYAAGRRAVPGRERPVREPQDDPGRRFAPAA
jgi:hypothetical protein